MRASRQAVSRTVGLLERQGPPPPGRAPGINVTALRLWIRDSADPIGDRNQLLPDLRKIVGSPIEEPSLWRIASTAWLLDESDLAITLLQDAMQRLRAPGVRGTSGGGPTRLRGGDPRPGGWGEALAVAALADGSYLQAFTQLRGLFSEDGTPLHNYASYLGVADLADAAVHADRRIEGRDLIEHALSHLNGIASPRLEQLIARARGILGGPDGAEAHFDKALADPARDQWPFERAQLRLDHAEWLRRRRRIHHPQAVLTQALGTVPARG